MAYTYSKIASYTVGSGGISNVSFVGIPQNYTHLILKVSARTTRAYLEDSMVMRFNTDSGSSYQQKVLYSDNTTNSSGVGTQTYFDFYVCGDTATANTFSSANVTILNYANSNYKATSVDSATENNATTSMFWIQAGLWNKIEPVTFISMSPNSGTWKQYSTFTLYGIKAEV